MQTRNHALEKELEAERLKTNTLKKRLEVPFDQACLWDSALDHTICHSLLKINPSYGYAKQDESRLKRRLEDEASRRWQRNTNISFLSTSLNRNQVAKGGYLLQVSPTPRYLGIHVFHIL